MVPESRSAYPAVLYLTGSTCRSVVHELPHLRPLVGLGFAVLAPEKRGVRPQDGGEACSDEFLNTNDRHQRVADADRVLASARGLLPAWNGALVIVGASEGGTIAPEIAVRHPSTVALALMGAGGWSQGEELRRSRAKEMELQGETSGAVEEYFQTLGHRFDEIRRNPTPDRFWLGQSNTYKRWASYLDYAPLEFLSRLTCPVFLAIGTEDTSVPVESAAAVSEEFRRLGKTTLTYLAYEGLDHRWADRRGRSHFARVGGDLLNWLGTTGSQGAR